MAIANGVAPDAIFKPLNITEIIKTIKFLKLPIKELKSNLRVFSRTSPLSLE